MSNHFYAKLETIKADHPHGFSPLHTLYPGRLWPVTQTYDKYIFPHPNPNAARDAFLENKENTVAYGRDLEIRAREGPGIGEDPANKMTYHQVDDPSMLIEDPALLHLTQQQPPAFNDAMDKGLRVPPTAPTPPTPPASVKENFGIVGAPSDRLWIAVFALLGLLVVAKISTS